MQRRYAQKRRKLIKKLTEEALEELKSLGLKDTHEVKVNNNLGTESPSTDLRIAKTSQPRIKGALWLEKETEKRRKPSK